MKSKLVSQPEVTEEDIKHLDIINHESCDYDDKKMKIHLNDVQEFIGK